MSNITRIRDILVVLVCVYAGLLLYSQTNQDQVQSDSDLGDVYLRQANAIATIDINVYQATQEETLQHQRKVNQLQQWGMEVAIYVGATISILAALAITTICVAWSIRITQNGRDSTHGSQLPMMLQTSGEMGDLESLPINHSQLQDYGWQSLGVVRTPESATRKWS